MISGEAYILKEVVYDDDKFRKYTSLTIGQVNATYTAVAKEDWKAKLLWSEHKQAVA